MGESKARRESLRRAKGRPVNRREKGGFAAGCCVALLLITLCAAAGGGGVLWYVGRTMAQPGSASMQGASPVRRAAERRIPAAAAVPGGDTVDTVLAKMTLAEKGGPDVHRPLPGTGRGGEGCGIPFGRLYPVPGKILRKKHPCRRRKWSGLSGCRRAADAGGCG